MYAGKKSGAAEAFAMEKTRMEICSTVPFYRRSERWRRIKQALPAALHKAKGVLWGDRALSLIHILRVIDAIFVSAKEHRAVKPEE